MGLVNKDVSNGIGVITLNGSQPRPGYVLVD